MLEQQLLHAVVIAEHHQMQADTCLQHPPTAHSLCHAGSCAEQCHASMFA